jgi:hypothetical protein
MTISADWISRVFHDAGGFTGNTYYFRLVRRGDAKIWDNVAQELATAPTWADSAIAMTDAQSTGDYPVVIPSEVTAGHDYSVIIYLQAGGSPANTDDAQDNYIQKIGDIFGF